MVCLVFRLQMTTSIRRRAIRHHHVIIIGGVEIDLTNLTLLPIENSAVVIIDVMIRHHQMIGPNRIQTIPKVASLSRKRNGALVNIDQSIGIIGSTIPILRSLRLRLRLLHRGNERKVRWRTFSLFRTRVISFSSRKKSGSHTKKEKRTSSLIARKGKNARKQVLLESEEESRKEEGEQRLTTAKEEEADRESSAKKTKEDEEEKEENVQSEMSASVSKPDEGNNKEVIDSTSVRKN